MSCRKPPLQQIVVDYPRLVELFRSTADAKAVHFHLSVGTRHRLTDKGSLLLMTS